MDPSLPISTGGSTPTMGSFSFQNLSCMKGRQNQGEVDFIKFCLYYNVCWVSALGVPISPLMKFIKNIRASSNSTETIAFIVWSLWGTLAFASIVQCYTLPSTPGLKCHHLCPAHPPGSSRHPPKLLVHPTQHPSVSLGWSVIPWKWKPVISQWPKHMAVLVVGGCVELLDFAGLSCKEDF